MSRIEEAIEKAARLRESDVQVKVALKQGVAVKPPLLPPLPSQEEIKLSSPLLVTVNNPHTPVAEEYRKLKSLIVKMTSQENHYNTIMITSSVGGEGKSTTALNLAISMAQEHDHTVLLVDADLRKPSLHKYLELDPQIGLSNCLMEDVEIGDVLIKTGIGRLSLLPSGKPVRNPAELFSSQKMKNLVQELKHRYPDRYIVIDTPPVLPFAETLSISRIVDGILFVVKEGDASMANVQEALNSFKDANVMGLVYSQAESARLDISSYYYYHGHEGHTAGAKQQKSGFWGRLFR